MLNVNLQSAGYQQGFALSPMRFTVPDRCITGILGPNGSGKTTLLRSICQDIKAEGRFEIDGKEISSMSYRQRARALAIVPQNIEKFPIPVADFVLGGRTPYKRWYQLTYRKEDLEAAETNLEKAGLLNQYGFAALQTKRIDELSGGERQLCALARALCQSPKVLLLDEPTSNLDMANQVRILRTVREISRTEDLSILLVVHDINIAIAYCQHILLLAKGRLAAQGETRETLQKERLESIYRTELCQGKYPLNENPVFLPVY